MDEAILKNITDFLNKYNRVLIVIPETDLSIDKTVGALALSFGLEKIGKSVKVVTSGHIPERLSIFSETSKVDKLSSGSSRLTLQLNTQHAELGELSYEQLSGQVNIYLHAKNGKFHVSDVTIKEDNLQFEAILTLGAATLEELGDTFSNNTELFYSVPRLNLDISPDSQPHGTTNVVDVTLSSISELVYHVLVALKEEVVPSVATLLLSGLLSATGSLNNNRTSPKTFAVAADLTAAGGDYNLVVKSLYKNERLGFLKLWGRSLAKLTPIPGLQVAYVVLQQVDFEKTGEKPSAVIDILSGFDANVHEYKNIVVVAITANDYIIATLMHPQLIVGKFVEALGIIDYKIQHLDSGRSFLLGHKKFGTYQIEEELQSAVSLAVVA